MSKYSDFRPNLPINNVYLDNSASSNNFVRRIRTDFFRNENSNGVILPQALYPDLFAKVGLIPDKVFDVENWQPLNPVKTFLSLNTSESTYNNGRFIISLSGSTAGSWLSSTNGINWANTSFTNTIGTRNVQYTSIYGDGKFVFIGAPATSGPAITVTTNGINFTQSVNTPITGVNHIYAGCYGLGRFYFFTFSANPAATLVTVSSTNGINWANTASSNVANFNVADGIYNNADAFVSSYSNGRFFINYQSRPISRSPFGNYGITATSTDAINWVKVDVSDPFNFFIYDSSFPIYHNNKWHNISRTTGNFYNSTNGINWTLNKNLPQCNSYSNFAQTVSPRSVQRLDFNKITDYYIFPSVDFTKTILTKDFESYVTMPKSLKPSQNGVCMFNGVDTFVYSSFAGPVISYCSGLYTYNTSSEFFYPYSNLALSGNFYVSNTKSYIKAY